MTAVKCDCHIHEVSSSSVVMILKKWDDNRMEEVGLIALTPGRNMQLPWGCCGMLTLVLLGPGIYRWLSARLQYLHCISNGDTAVLHQAIDMSDICQLLFANVLIFVDTNQ